jgi:hypothetical protein
VEWLVNKGLQVYRGSRLKAPWKMQVLLQDMMLSSRAGLEPGLHWGAFQSDHVSHCKKEL